MLEIVLSRFRWSASIAGLLVLACGSPRPHHDVSAYDPPPADTGDGGGDSSNGNEDPADDDDDDLAANGRDCEEDSECKSGICADTITGRVCSECADDTQCPAEGQSCVWDASVGYRRCSAGELGDPCQGDIGCANGACRIRPGAPFGLCSDCRDAQHCRDQSAGINCTMDLNAGYYRCSTGALGEECYAIEDCQSALCRPEGEEAGYGKCSECMTDAQCRQSGQGPNCTNKIPADLSDPTYFLCGTGALGEMCEDNLACVEQRCNAEHCSECLTAKQCRDENNGRNCVYRSSTRHIGWHICTEGLAGEPCTEHEACQPDLRCAPQFARSTCAECADDGDCQADSVCSVGYPGEGRLCVAADSLPHNTYCQPGVSGDTACAGHCVELAEGTGPAELPAVGVGVCGACRPDANDCAAGETCIAPSYTPGIGVTGSACVESR